VITRRTVLPVTLRVGSLVLLGIVTIVLAIGVVHMVSTLKKELNGFGLLYTGLLLYGCNILMFALWYWEIDGGGPERRQQAAHQLFDFLFPQQMGGLDEKWAPHFLIISMWLLPVQLLLVQPIRCPCHIVRNFS